MFTDPEDRIQVLYLNYGNETEQESARNKLKEIRTEIPNTLAGFDLAKGMTNSYPVNVVGTVTAGGKEYQIVKMADDNKYTEDNKYSIYQNGKLLRSKTQWLDPNSVAVSIYGLYGTNEEKNKYCYPNVKLNVPTTNISDFQTKNPLENLPTSGTSNILTGAGDRTGMTATPIELPWTIEGAIERSKTDPAGKTWQKIQGENLSKWNVGTSSIDMALNKKYYIGKDEETGDRKYISESPYQIIHGYNPNDPDYSTIKSNLEKSSDTINQSIENINLYSSQAESQLSGLKENLNLIKSSKPGSVWSYDLNQEELKTQSPTIYNWINENIGFKNKYSKKEAEKLTNYFIDLNEDILNQRDILPKLNKQKQDISNKLYSVKQYEKLGYEVDIIDEGYDFHLPKASTVHSAIFGDKEAVALTSASFIESPLAIKTFGSAIWQWATGDEKVGETRREELAQFSLGLKEGLVRGDYGMRILSSPAMVQGVYLPALAYGGGYALTGLSAGASGTVSGATSTLAKIGATQGGRVLTAGSKIGMAGFGIYGLKTTGENLYKTYQERPEALPGQLAEIGFTFGMAYTGFRTGKTMYNYRNPSIGAPRDTFFKQMGETYKNKIVGNSKLLGKIYEKIDVIKEQKNVAKMYKPTTIGRITGKIGRTVFKKQYQQSIRDYPQALASDQLAVSKRLPMYEYRDSPDYAQPRLEAWQDKVAMSKYLQSHQKAKIVGVDVSDAQVDIIKPGFMRFEANVKGVTETGGKIPAGKVSGYSKVIGGSDDMDDVTYSIYKALYSRGKTIQSSNTKILPGSKSAGTEWHSVTTNSPAEEIFSYRKWLQGITRSEKIGEYNLLTKSGDLSIGENIVFTKDIGFHSKSFMSNVYKDFDISKGITEYRTIGSGTTYKTVGNIYSKPSYILQKYNLTTDIFSGGYDYKGGINFIDIQGKIPFEVSRLSKFEKTSPYKGSGTIADLTGGKEYAGGMIKGSGSGSSNLNQLYHKNIFETIKPQLTDIVKESFRSTGSSSGGSSSYGIGDITQYEWYQTPLNSYTPITQVGGSINLSGYASAYGAINLKTLDFLEEGTQYTSAKWTNVKPSSRKIISPSAQQEAQNLLSNQDVISNIGIGEINLLKEGTGTIQIGGTKTDYFKSPDINYITETTTKTDLKNDSISKITPIMKQSTSQGMKQLMKQDTAQVLQLQQAQQLETSQFFSTPTIITPSPPPPKIPEFPSPPPPKILDNTPNQVKRIIKTKNKSKPRVINKGEGDKGLLSDLLSVTRSQARYGVATHPKLSKETWKEGAKTLYSHVPTKELKQNKKNKKKKPKLFRRNKDVFI